jgi:Concanavalin A-like lectin/glucanases superfamily
MKQVFTFLFLFFYSLTAKSQDTISVQAFNFKSSAKRDTMVKFPSGNYKNYEKILLQYTMRCKNALVSTAADRNKGCGEWDYSCNSYLTDSTRVDSLLSFAPNYIISGIKDNFFSYTKKPTYSYTLFKQKAVNVSAINSEKTLTIGNGTEQLSHPFVADAQTAKTFYLIKSNEITNTFGSKINGLEIQLDATMASAKFLKIKLKETTQTELSPDNLDMANASEVYFQDTPLDVIGYKKLYFHSPFNVNIGKNILVEISYHNPSILTNIKALGTKTDFKSAAYTTENDGYVQMSGDGIVEIPTDSMKSINNEITISFWSKGSKNLPANTGIANANDDKGGRQVMIHLPWSDGNIIWDCGGDAAGYDRIIKAGSASDFKDKWTFWTFTKNTVTKTMKIYINGVLWYNVAGKTKPINIKKMILGNEINGGNIPYQGGLDNFSMWNKELDIATIKQLMTLKIDASHPNYNNLVCHYNFNEKQGETTLKDASKNNISAKFTVAPAKFFFQGREQFKDFVFSDKRLNIKLLNGDYTSLISQSNVLDSVQNAPNKVRSFYVENNDLKEGKTSYLWQAGDFDVLDENGVVINTITRR